MLSVSLPKILQRTRCGRFIILSSQQQQVLQLQQHHGAQTTIATAVIRRQQQQRRWMGAPNKHNRKKRIEKSDLNPEDQHKKPIFTERLEKDLEILEKRFERLDKERPGRNRGIECARQMVLEEKIEKNASTACGNIYLNNWIYRRFTYPLGYTRITNVPGIVLANKLIREGTKIRFDRYKDPKLIILEMYRYPDVRPTMTQKKYLKMDDNAEMTPEQAKRILNFDDYDDVGDEDAMFTTPEEEDDEKRILERTIFAGDNLAYNNRRQSRSSTTTTTTKKNKKVK